MNDTLGWTDIEDIALELSERHADLDPLTIRFTELRALVEALPNFQPDPDHTVNEQILEAIQAAWIEEVQGGKADPDERGYEPPRPYKPEL